MMAERGGSMQESQAHGAEVASEQAPVVAARCDEYQLDSVRAALRAILAPLGGMAAFVRPGERIALKPNLLLGTAPELAIVTHPAVTAAVAIEVKEAGAHPIVVESPGSGIVHAKTFIERVYRKTGYREASETYGFDLNLDTTYETASYPDGRLVRRFEVMTPILRADGVINLCKFKTHTFQIFTGATKNLFGVIPGLNKVGYHGRFADPVRFGEMLLDVAAFAAPRLSIMDAVVGLEGKGPGTGGKARPLGFLLAGTDTVAIDVACCRIGRIDTAAVPVLVAARERRLWSGRSADVDTLGVPVADLQVQDFALPERRARDRGDSPVTLVETLSRRVLQGGFTPMPRPKQGRCTRCAACEQACPTGAMSMGEKVAQVDDSLCIRCYCCHEVCPEAAIDLEFKGWGRVVNRLGLAG
jgi:uncharacterized protein (DUF362 family)/NAD-dependent dihydropyrimidine dehydrogenase PreA subunit